MKIVAEIMLQAEKRIKEDLKKINQDIEDFDKPLAIPSVLNMTEREAYFAERMTGRLSTDNLTKNYQKKLKLENELQDIANFKYHNEEWFK
jgi:hypothetical protein